VTNDAGPAVVVVGSVNLDFTLEVARLPVPGETVLAERVRRAIGGKGANQAVASARQGIPTAFVGAVGEDPEGVELLEGLARESLDLTFTRRVEGAPSGRAFIAVDGIGRNTVIVAGGANGSLTGPDVDTAAAMIGRAAVVLTQLEISDEAVVAALSAGRAGKALTVLNPAPARPLDARLLALCDVLVPNSTEAAILSGCDDAETAAQALARRAPGATIIVTRGEEGALLLPPGGPVTSVPAIPVDPVDTVAAGDAFCGVLAAAMAAGRTLTEAVRQATAAGAHAVTIRGAIPSLPRASDVAALLDG